MGKHRWAEKMNGSKPQPVLGTLTTILGRKASEFLITINYFLPLSDIKRNSVIMAKIFSLLMLAAVEMHYPTLFSSAITASR